MGFALSDLQLSSDAFPGGGRIPERYTGIGKDVSPPLRWSNVPVETRSFALFCHDPDAPLVLPGSYGFTHWVLYNIPGSVRELPEAVDQYTLGRGDFGKDRYGGPLPPPGHGVHHYYFWLAALGLQISLPPGLTLRQLLGQIEPHVIGMNRLVGIFERS